MFNQIVLAVGTVLILLAISIVSVGYLWHLLKPAVERAELKLLDVNQTKVKEIY